MDFSDQGGAQKSAAPPHSLHSAEPLRERHTGLPSFRVQYQRISANRQYPAERRVVVEGVMTCGSVSLHRFLDLVFADRRRGF